jgi:serine/threonine protein kinase
MTLGPGSRLGNYTITRSLGSGGMADVYEAHDETLERTVALKVLPLEYTRNPQLVARFQKEVRAAAKLNHRNIVTVFEVGHQDSYHYFSMRLLTGGDLRKRIERGLTSLEALAILRELADAFAHAHARGFIHRDVKPENVMFDEQGFPVLTDFGIAKALDANTHMTRTGMTMGTPRYLAPEQASGKPVDARADLYSLGIILFEMLTGQPPYDAEESMAVIFKHVTEPIPQLPEVFVRFQPLLEKLMAKEPKQRMASAEDLMRAIDELAPRGSTRELPQSQLRTAENPLLAGLLTPSPLRTPPPKTPRPVTPAPVARPPAGPESGEVAIAPPLTTREILARRPAAASTPVRGVPAAAAPAVEAPTIAVSTPARRLSPAMIAMVAGGLVAVVTTGWALRAYVMRPAPAPTPVAVPVPTPAPVETPDAAKAQAAKEKEEAARREQERQAKLREQEAQRKVESEAALRRQQQEEQARQEQLRLEREAAARRAADEEARKRAAAESEAKRRAQAQAEAERKAEAEAAARRQRQEEAAEEARLARLREEEERKAAEAARKKQEQQKAKQLTQEEKEKLAEEQAKERVRRPAGF